MKISACSLSDEMIILGLFNCPCLKTSLAYVHCIVISKRWLEIVLRASEYSLTRCEWFCDDKKSAFIFVVSNSSCEADFKENMKSMPVLTVLTHALNFSLVQVQYNRKSYSRPEIMKWCHVTIMALWIFDDFKDILYVFVCYQILYWLTFKQQRSCWVLPRSIPFKVSN